MAWTRGMGGGLWLAGFLLLVLASRAGADGMQASADLNTANWMKAFINPYGVVIEIEIDPKEAEIALPRLIARTTKAEALPTPTPKRSELRLEADGKALSGWVETFVKHRRVARDPVTGKPLDEPGEGDVLFLRVRYPFPSRPDQLLLRPPMDRAGKPSIELAFVAFHDGVPVNELASLNNPETLLLDWNDPSQSRFARASIRRKHQAPVSVFLYVEPHELRAEVVGRVTDFAPFLNLKLEPDEEIPAEAREEMLAKVAWLVEHNMEIQIDGGARPGAQLDSIHFITRDVHAAHVVAPEERTLTREATIAAIFVYPVHGLPNEVRLRWELFGEGLPKVSASATDQRRSTALELTPDDKEMQWVNAAGRTARPAKLQVSAPSSMVRIPMLLTFGCLLALALAVVAIRRRSRWLAGGALAFLLLGCTARSLATYTVLLSPRVRPPSGAEAKPTLEALVYNVYRAVDGPQDNGAHAKLRTSVSDDIVESIYRDIVPSLHPRGQHSSRLRIHDVEMLEVEPVDAPGSSDISYRCKWQSHGSIGHWGHLHERTLLQDGVITLASEDGAWKITRLEILSSQPVDAP